MQPSNDMIMKNIGTLEWDMDKGYLHTSDFKEMRPMTVQDVSGNLLVGEDKLPDNTGVFLSTSSAADSHEWEALICHRTSIGTGCPF